MLSTAQQGGPGGLSLAGEATEEAKGRFREIVLAAPDIDAGFFRRDSLPRLSLGRSRVTLYTSSADEALSASKCWHGYPKPVMLEKDSSSCMAWIR